MHVFGGKMVYIFYPVLKAIGDAWKVKTHWPIVAVSKVKYKDSTLE